MWQIYNKIRNILGMSGNGVSQHNKIISVAREYIQFSVECKGLLKICLLKSSCESLQEQTQPDKVTKSIAITLLTKFSNFNIEFLTWEKKKSNEDNYEVLAFYITRCIKVSAVLVYVS